MYDEIFAKSFAGKEIFRNFAAREEDDEYYDKNRNHLHVERCQS